MAENLYYGRGKDEENKSLIAFLDEVFFTDDEECRDFLNLLPKCYKDKYRPAYNNFTVKDENGEFRAAIGCFYNDMLVGGEPISACCIGNVAVGEKYRSKGYMIDLMKMSVEDMGKNGVDVAYLGGHRQRYGYFGFESSGTSYNFGIGKGAFKHAFKSLKCSLEVEKLRGDDTESIAEIERLYSKNVIRSVRPTENCFDILRSWRDCPYILKKDGKLVGYFILSYDKTFVSEIGVEDKKYYPEVVAAAVERSKNGSMRFRVPPFDIQQVEFFTENFDEFGIGGCEMILVYNFEKVIRAYLKAKASYSKLCDGSLTLLIHGVCGDEKLKIKVLNNQVSVEKFDGEAEIELGRHAATRAFFSNLTADRAAFPPHAQQWLPLHMYLFNADTM